MPQGLQTWNASGKMTLDFTDATSRVIGVQTITSWPYFEQKTVTLTPGKRLWWYCYSSGSIRVLVFRATFVNPSLDQKENQFSIQVDPNPNGGASFGSATIIWGEC
jgi:hypothetical protein